VNGKLNKDKEDIQAKKFKRASLNFLLLILVSVTTYHYFWGTFFSKPQFPINTIQVVGEIENLKRQALQSAMMGYLDAGFFTVNVTAIKNAVEKLEWIESASVRRIWPDKIRVLVTEQKAIAQWDGKALINRNGALFSPEKVSFPEKLVSFKGPDAMRIELLELYQELQPMLQKQALMISELELNSRRALEITLSNGIKLVFGKQRDIRDSSVLIERFLAACKQGLADKMENIAIVDLRYTNGFSVRWRNQENKTASSGSSSGSDSKEDSNFSSSQKITKRVSVNG